MVMSKLPPKQLQIHHISFVQANLYCNDAPCHVLKLYTSNFAMKTCHQNNEVAPGALDEKLHV